MLIYRNMDYPSLILLFTLVVFVMMIFVLIVIVTGVAPYAQAISGTTTTNTTPNPHVTIAFVGNTSPIAGIDHVSVAGIATYNAATSSKNIEQKILTVFWGDGTTSQSKITRIPSSSEGKWGPLYHKYDSPTAISHPHEIVATMQIPSYSSSNKGFVQIKSETFLVNVQKDPIKTSSMDSLKSSTYVVSKNDGLSLNLISHSVNVIALTIIGSVTACSIYGQTQKQQSKYGIHHSSL